MVWLCVTWLNVLAQRVLKCVQPWERRPYAVYSRPAKGLLVDGSAVVHTCQPEKCPLQMPTWPKGTSTS